MEIKELVQKYLTEVPQTRNNDNLLIAYCMKAMHKTTDMFDIALMTNKNEYESIRRIRQKIQNEENPNLKPVEQVKKSRADYEEEMRKWARGI